MKRFLSRILPASAVRWHQYRQVAKTVPGLSVSRLNRLYREARAGIGEEGLCTLEATSASPVLQGAKVTSSKYTDVAFWLRVNVARANRVGVSETRGKTILDLGCGTGLFIAMCRYIGHAAYGMDLPLNCMAEEDRQIYGRCCNLLGVEKYVLRRSVTRELSFQNGSQHASFDIITAFMIRFYWDNGRYWNVTDWAIFLSAIYNRLKPGGHCHFEFNREPGIFPTTLYVDEATTALFRKMGRFVDGILMIRREL